MHIAATDKASIKKLIYLTKASDGNRLIKSKGLQHQKNYFKDIEYLTFLRVLAEI